jgi:hypothetical protein
MRAGKPGNDGTEGAARRSGKRGAGMSYVNPEIREEFESLSIDLKNEILSRNVRLHSLGDLIAVLREIVDEAETT